MSRVSYGIFVCLQDSILSILSTVMSPLSSSDTENVLSGGIYASSMVGGCLYTLISIKKINLAVDVFANRLLITVFTFAASSRWSNQFTRNCTGYLYVETYSAVNGC